MQLLSHVVMLRNEVTAILKFLDTYFQFLIMKKKIILNEPVNYYCFQYDFCKSVAIRVCENSNVTSKCPSTHCSLGKRVMFQYATLQTTVSCLKTYSWYISQKNDGENNVVLLSKNQFFNCHSSLFCRKKSEYVSSFPSLIIHK